MTDNHHKSILCGLLALSALLLLISRISAAKSRKHHYLEGTHYESI